MKILLAFLFFAFVSTAAAQSSMQLVFTPESDKFAEATKEYQTIWSGEGRKMVEAMERISGLKFKDTDIKVIVYEGVSNSGFRDSPMKMRASYPLNIKKATLIHELGHRLIAGLPKTGEIDEHRALFLVLYDIWEKLYGQDFADQAVEAEKQRKGLYDYESAWKWALSQSQKERAEKFKVLRESMVKDKD